MLGHKGTRDLHHLVTQLPFLLLFCTYVCCALLVLAIYKCPHVYMGMVFCYCCFVPIYSTVHYVKTFLNHGDPVCLILTCLPVCCIFLIK